MNKVLLCLFSQVQVAIEIVKSYGDCVLAIGESDEYSFVFKRKTTLFNRRKTKILTTIVSQFTSMYVFYWPQFMKTPLQYPPSFDGRIVIYPSLQVLFFFSLLFLQNIRDYISWRQADTHINNLYNTCFWALVLRGKETTTSAEKILNGSLSSEKNEILFSRFGINYNNEPEIFKKGSIVIRETKERILERMETKPATISCPFSKEEIESLSDGTYETVVLHCDVIRDKPFWEEHSTLLDLFVCFQ